MFRYQRVCLRKIQDCVVWFNVEGHNKVCKRGVAERSFEADIEGHPGIAGDADRQRSAAAELQHLQASPCGYRQFHQAAEAVTGRNFCRNRLRARRGILHPDLPLHDCHLLPYGRNNLPAR